MTRAEYVSRLRAALTGTFLCVAAVTGFATAVALLLMGVVGIALLVEGLLSWMHPHDAASAWARTLAGIGLIGGSIGLAALGWLARERLAASERNVLMSRRLKFAAVLGFLLALICLPFAAAIRASAHGPWLGWGG